MNRTYFFVLVGLAFASLFLIGYTMWDQEASLKKNGVNNSPHPISPFKRTISAIGIVEAGSENIFIGSPVNRLVEKVFVSAGNKVRMGDPLIEFEHRDLDADLHTQETAYAIALANLKKLQELPRSEDLAFAEAELQNSELELNQAKRLYESTQSLRDSRAMNQEEINRRRFHSLQAQAKLEQAKANFNKVKAGTWKPDLEIAKLQAQQAKNQVEKIQTEIQRMTVRSPIDGKILQIKIHEGEVPHANFSNSPLMVVGDTEEKRLEVSINQVNASYFRPQAQATAFLQGNPTQEYPLEFVKLEPYLVNKQHLANNLTEKVDTRVLQVTYQFKNTPKKLYVGQVMDVFIDSEVDDMK
ncbi:MAG: HlyD family efflux transporter periplasmic adaptor subunit [Candidatus Protochlamydia sp.]|nr:HlyD family efflux transporter periplasmic adaptor subunit [Candidatus Protochlamydia sp.]